MSIFYSIKCLLFSPLFLLSTIRCSYSPLFSEQRSLLRDALEHVVPILDYSNPFNHEFLKFWDHCFLTQLTTKAMISSVIKPEDRNKSGNYFNKNRIVLLIHNLKEYLFIMNTIPHSFLHAPTTCSQTVPPLSAVLPLF